MLHVTVSIIIPTYNRPQYLRRAIQSVVEQTFTDWELIVVQNGGTRESEAVVGEFQNTGAPIRYIYESKADPVNARNVGITLSQGTYVAFLDDDDRWAPHKLEKQVGVLERDSRVGLVTCGAWIIRPSGSIEPDLTYTDEMFTVSELVKRGCLIRSLSGVVVRRSCIDRIGAFDPRYVCANDYDFYLRLAWLYRIASLQEFLFLYQVSGDSISKHLERMREECVQILTRLDPATHDQVTRAMIRQRIARWCHAMAVDAMDQKRYRHARRFYIQALRHDPLIGSKLSWGRWSHVAYRLVRPYAALAYCSVASIRKQTTMMERS